jgi:hypothetical protein
MDYEVAVIGSGSVQPRAHLASLPSTGDKDGKITDGRKSPKC